MDGNEKLYNFKKRSRAAALVCMDESRTVQSDSVDADINTIVRRFGITGKMPDNLRIPTYGDYDDVDDFLSASLVIKDAETEFMKIPAEIRAQFEHDAGHFFNYAANPDNYDGLVALGLAKARPVQPMPAAVPVPPVVPPADPVTPTA